MPNAPEPPPLPTDLAAAHAMIPAERAARLASELAVERLKLEVARLRRERFGTSSERGARIDQLELVLEDLEETLAETQAQAAAQPEALSDTASSRRKPARRPLPKHLPRQRVVHPGPTTCACCGGTRLRPLGEDVTETSERIPARWVVIQHVRERFSCSDCETIAQTPAPFHPIPRGRAGPNLLAKVMMAKFGLHLPLHRQSQRFAHEGVPIDVSTLAGWVGAVTTALSPLVARIEAHVRGAERLHPDDTPVPVLAKSKTRTGRLWTVVRDDRPFGGPEPPAVAYFYSPDRSGAHAETWLGDAHGLMQADAFSGFGRLYEPGRKPSPLREAACSAHTRRKFFELANLRKAPIALEAVARIDAIFAVERSINGLGPDERRAHRNARSAAFVAELKAWLLANRAKLSAKAQVAQAIDYMLKRWSAFILFLDDGRVCLSNNAAERAIRPIALGRRNWTFAGSDAGGHRAAALYTLIETAKLNSAEPQAWLDDILSRQPGHPARQIDDLLPWNWTPPQPKQIAA